MHRSPEPKKRLLALIVASLLGVVLISQVVAQDAASGPSLDVATSEEWGEHLVTADGMSVYLYVLDEDGTLACVDACTTNWLPVMADADAAEGADATLAEGLDSELLGTVERPDGGAQLTYGGHPLYTFRRDTEAGHTRGQALGDQFFLVSVAGEAVTEREEQEAVEIDEEAMASLMSDGRLVFTSNCAVCHGAEGQGGIGPGFVGNGVIDDSTFVINRIIDGFIDHGMPPFGHLSDRQIASVATYIRNSWGNEFGPVLEEEVAAER